MKPQPSLKQQWARWPGSAPAALALAKAQPSQERGAAEIWLRRTLACDPRQTDALVTFASLAIEAGSADAGRRALRRAAAVNPSLPSAWLGLGTLSWQAKSYSQALECKRRFLALDRAGPSIRMQAAILEALAGSPAAAASLAADALTGDPSQFPVAVNAGVIALAENRASAAALLLDQVLALRPDYVDAIFVLKHARVAASQSPEDMREVRRHWRSAGALHPKDAARVVPGYLVARGYGCGFWGEVLNTAINLALADIMGRTPVVFWGEEVRYRHPQQNNAWELYFEPVSDVGIGDLAESDAGIFPRHWQPRSLTTMEHIGDFAQQIGHVSGLTGLVSVNRPEAIVVSDGYVDMNDVLPWASPGHRWTSASALDVFREVFARRIRPQRAIAAELDRNAEQLFGARPHVAVHVRAQSQGKNEESLESSGVGLRDYFARVDPIVAAQPGIGVFLLTDLDHAVAAFRERYGERVTSLDRLRLIQPEGVLPGVSDLGFDRSLDGYRLGLEVLIDAYLAARCERFVGDGASGVSSAIVALKDWPDDKLTLLRRNVFAERGGRLSGPFGKSS